LEYLVKFNADQANNNGGRRRNGWNDLACDQFTLETGYSRRLQCNVNANFYSTSKERDHQQSSQ